MQASTSTGVPTAAAELAEDLLVLWRHVMSTGEPRAYAIFEELDLSLTQVKALVALSHGELSVKELAERLGLSLPGASRAVDALVSRELLDRREDPSDRRQKRLRCTDAGLEALRRLDEARLVGISAFAATLPAARCRRVSAALRPILDDLRERG
jgi:DNA-binding MarR family transcriptional regulator